MSQEAAVRLHSTTVQNVRVTVTGASATQISLTYHSPNGNQPNKFGNSLYIWQSGDQIPWQTDALSTQALTTNSPDGDASFQDLDVTNNSYIIGYAVGPIDSAIKWSKYANVVASAFVPAIGGDAQAGPESSSIVIQKIGATSLVAAFGFLDGYDPQGSGAWAGIWQGSAVSYFTPPKWSAQISGSTSNGTVSFNNISITRGSSYTVGLYATGYNKTDPSKSKFTPLACAVSFTNG
jgi:hypothetical protein